MGESDYAIFIYIQVSITSNYYYVYNQLNPHKGNIIAVLKPKLMIRDFIKYIKDH